MFAGFLIVGYVIRSVGMDQWGMLTVSVSLVSILSILQSSISGSAGKRLTDYITVGDKQEYEKYLLCTFYLTFLIVLVIFLLFLFYFVFFLNNLIDKDVNTFKSIFLLTGINVTIQVLALPGIAILQSLNRIDYQSKATIMGLIIRFCLVFTLFSCFTNIVFYSIILLMEIIFFTSFIYYIIARRTEINLVPTKKSIHWTYLIDVMKFNSLNLFNNLNYVIFLQLPAVIITKKLGLTMAGYYGVGLQINSLVRGFASVLGSAVMPIFNIFKASKNEVKLRQIFLISSKLFAYLSIVSSFFFLLFAKEFLYLWLENEDLELISFINGFFVFVAIGIFFLPNALILVTMEKLKVTSLFGFLLAISCSCLIYFFPVYDDPLRFINIFLGLFFFSYNVHRFIVSNQFLQISIKKSIFLLISLIIPIAFLITFSEFDVGLQFYQKCILFILISLLSLFLFNREDWNFLFGTFKSKL